MPAPAAVAEAVRFVFSSIPARSRVLSRIHFHCLAYHIAVERIPQARGVWLPAGPALARGSVVATTQACDKPVADFQDGDVELLAPTRFVARVGSPELIISSKSPIPSWNYPAAEAPFDFELQFTLVPVLVCVEPKQTVGLGDAISATGLAYSL